MYEEAMTSLKLDPPPFSRVSLALPAPPTPNLEETTKKAIERRPSRFEVVKAPEMFTVTAVDESTLQDTLQTPIPDPLTPSPTMFAEQEDVSANALDTIFPVI